jgi:hypothetical protein
MSEVVFILGAGASKDSGAPLMAEFLTVAEELRKREDLENFGKDFDVVFEVISHLQVVHSKADLDLDNIESVFAAFEMGRLIGNLPGHSSVDFKSLSVSMRRLISKTLERTVRFRFMHGRIFPLGFYDKFGQLIKELNEKAHGNKCSVITFNYDVALDAALDSHDIPPDYCLSEETKPNSIHLLKLHGSLNWAGCAKCNHIIPWTIKEFVKGGHLSFSGEGQGGFIDLATKLPASGLNHCGKSVMPDPIIIPPTWNKTEYHTTLSNIWKCAAKELSEAEYIFILGYSFPETDLFFKYFFALGSVGRSRIKRFWVYNPDRSVEPKFQKLLGPSMTASHAKEKFKFFEAPFSNAISDLTMQLLGRNWF